MNYDEFVFADGFHTFVEDINKALEWVTTREKVEIAARFGEVEISNDAKIKIRGNEYLITQYCLEKFCRRLGIPQPFARKIPSDLLLKNIKRLIEEKQEESFLFFSSKIGDDTVLIGEAKDNYVSADQEEFLKQMAEFQSDMWVPVNTLTTDRYVEFDFVNTEDSCKFDDLQLGLNIRNSDTGDVNAVARLFLYSEAEKSGFIMPREWGYVERLRNKKVSVESTLIKFASKIKDMDLRTDCIKKALQEASDTNMTDEDCVVFWQNAQRITKDKEMADEVFSITEEDRKAMLKTVKERKKANKAKAFNNEALEEPVELDSVYSNRIKDVMKLTKKYQYEEREQLRRLSGSMLNKLFPGEL